MVYVLDKCRLTGTLVQEYLQSSLDSSSVNFIYCHTSNQIPSLPKSADVLLINIDTFLNNISEYIRLLHRHIEATYIIIYSAHMYDISIPRLLLNEQVNGIILADASCHELLIGIRQVLETGCYISTSIQMSWLSQTSNEREQRPSTIGLSARENEVFKLIGHGKTVKEIAHLLCISEKTVHTYRDRIKTKYRITDSQALQHYAVESILRRSNQPSVSSTHL